MTDPILPTGGAATGYESPTGAVALGTTGYTVVEQISQLMKRSAWFNDIKYYYLDTRSAIEHPSAMIFVESCEPSELVGCTRLRLIVRIVITWVNSQSQEPEKVYTSIERFRQMLDTYDRLDELESVDMSEMVSGKPAFGEGKGLCHQPSRHKDEGAIAQVGEKMSLITMRDFEPWGYEVESVYGTDPASLRLPVLGDIIESVVTLDPQKQARRSVGSGVNPKGFSDNYDKIGYKLKYELADDNPTNSLIALALGSQPNVTTGVVTIYPTSTISNLRSCTFEGGFASQALDEYWLLKGCMIENCDLVFESGKVTTEMNFVVKSADIGATRALTAPTECTTSLFNPYGDGSLTINSTPTPTVYAEKMRLSISNKLKYSPTIDSGREIAYCEITGRDIFLEVTSPRADSTLLDIFKEPASSSSAIVSSIDLLLSKNSGSEYLKFTLSNAQLQGAYELGAKEGDELLSDTWRFQASGASAIAMDVKA